MHIPNTKNHDTNEFILEKIAYNEAISINEVNRALNAIHSKNEISEDNRLLYDPNFDFYIDTSNVKYYYDTTKGYKSYTFPIIREGSDAKLQNLVLSENTSGGFDLVILDYYVNEEEFNLIKNGNMPDLSHKIEHKILGKVINGTVEDNETSSTNRWTISYSYDCCVYAYDYYDGQACIESTCYGVISGGGGSGNGFPWGNSGGGSSNDGEIWNNDGYSGGGGNGSSDGSNSNNNDGTTVVTTPITLEDAMVEETYNTIKKLDRECGWELSQDEKQMLMDNPTLTLAIKAIKDFEGCPDSVWTGIDQIITDGIEDEQCLMDIYNYLGGSETWNDFISQFDGGLSITELSFIADSEFLYNTAEEDWNNFAQTELYPDGNIVIRFNTSNLLDTNILEQPKTIIALGFAHEIMHADMYLYLLENLGESVLIDYNENDLVELIENHTYHTLYDWYILEYGEKNDLDHVVLALAHRTKIIEILTHFNPSLNNSELEAL